MQQCDNARNNGKEDSGIVKQCQKFKVQFYYERVRYYLGVFETYEEALQAKKVFINGLEA